MLALEASTAVTFSRLLVIKGTHCARTGRDLAEDSDGWMKQHRELPLVCRKGPKEQEAFQSHLKGQEQEAASDACSLE